MLSERVARCLLEKGKVSPGQIDEARRTQAFFGGQLASHLLKLGYVDEASLGEALTEVSGARYASGDELRVIPPEVLALVPVSLVERHRVCPFRLESEQLLVAMLNPRDALAIAEVRAASGQTIDPWVTSEYRLVQALERHYRLRTEGVRSISLAPPSPTQQEPSGASPVPEPGSEKDKVEIGLDGRPLDAEVSFDLYAQQRPAFPDEGVGPRSAPGRAQGPADAFGGAVPADAPEGGARYDGSAGPSTVPESPDPLAALEAALVAAGDRDALASALLDFCEERSSRSAIFAVSRDGIRGLMGRGRGLGTDRVAGVSLPIGGSTILDAALKSRNFYFGVVPTLPANRDLYTALGGRIPSMALVLPIVVKDRTVALLYMDDRELPMTRPEIPLMLRVAAKAGLAFEILLLRNKIREL